MSLLGGYRKKPGGDGYESLQLVESGAEGGGGGAGAVGAGGRSPSRQQQQQQQQQHRADGSTMDSSGASSPDMESSYGGGLLDMVKGGAGRLFSNLKDNLKDTLKDTSSKVMQSVASYTKGELDISYITSRIIELLCVKTKAGHVAPWHRREMMVSECSWPVRQAPSLHNLYAVCKNMHNWLQQNPKNVCVIHCMVSTAGRNHSFRPDGRAASAVLVSAMFCFCHLFSNPGPAMQLLNTKRPGIVLWPSHRR
ncbi:hypothetical protein ASZ78_013893 [Callipepla squamata]|uniref:Uncharacterized protein n=1 Tax=Callipepla squamata TaxID=9009 RepID=A0A226NGG0_CALSU|nr:hypothetical protein ASZ78_013893 [Callipepla squamata]